MFEQKYPYHARNATHKAAPHYECRVMRSVEPNQPDLKKPLSLLKDNTSDLVTYKRMGTMGVTLVMLDPVLRQIMPTNNRNGAIPREPLADFERELNEQMEHAHYTDYQIPLENPDFYPLELYGHDKRYLGIQLRKRDYRLIGDRAMVEQYIRDNYDVGKRFLARNLVKIQPHITIGQINYENISDEDRRHLHTDPSDFILRSAQTRMRQNAEEYGTSMSVDPINFPETVTLNGLRIFCQQR